jgi:hypothetical protein
VIFPSIYRAKATRWSGTALTVLVPQIFGEAPVEVTDFTGTPTTGMGWVLFQGGNPEFPVWLGRSVSVGGGTVEFPEIPPQIDEVWVGPTEPTDPDIELWFDPDEVIPTARQAVEAKGTITSYTLKEADENKVLWFSSGSNITLTVPTFASVPIPDGWRCDIMQSAAGRITVAGAGITFVATPTLVLRAAGSTASLLRLPVLNTWLLTGDMG